MAPALVHFLVGASVLLLLAIPLVRRSIYGRGSGLWLVSAGGLWGLGPDIHHIAPVFGDELRWLHDSLWANLFVAHGVLDHPIIRERAIESIAVAITCFLLAVGGFQLAARAGAGRARMGATRAPSRRAQVDRVVAVAIGVVVATLCIATVLGGMAAITGRIDAVAALVGRDEAHIGWALLLAVSAVASVGLATLSVLVPARYARNPLAGALVGLQGGLLAWAVGIAVALPLWLRIVRDTPQPLPFVDWPSLVALAVAGALAGACYPLIRGFVVPAAAPR